MGLALQRLSIAGPLKGEVPARVEVRGFFVRTTFDNPDPTGERNWDIGVSWSDGSSLFLEPREGRRLARPLHSRTGRGWQPCWLPTSSLPYPMDR